MQESIKVMLLLSSKSIANKTRRNFNYYLEKCKIIMPRSDKKQNKSQR